MQTGFDRHRSIACAANPRAEGLLAVRVLLNRLAVLVHLSQHLQGQGGVSRVHEAVQLADAVDHLVLGRFKSWDGKPSEQHRDQRCMQQMNRLGQPRLFNRGLITLSTNSRLYHQLLPASTLTCRWCVKR
jgi:hypothetical protein